MRSQQRNRQQSIREVPDFITVENDILTAVQDDYIKGAVIVFHTNTKKDAIEYVARNLMKKIPYVSNYLITKDSQLVIEFSDMFSKSKFEKHMNLLTATNDRIQKWFPSNGSY